MELSAELRTALAAADDAYLIGLSNKGTLNRAKKDLAALSPTMAGETVTIGTESCTIRVPLGDSKCTCPSSSMCRHRLAAILWLREQIDTEPEEKQPEFPSLLTYPTEKLVKQLGPKRLSGILFRHRSGAGPEIAESSVVTVELPWLPATVRLLEPLEHSTCSCKSKTFCLHRAEALLYWQLYKGVVSADSLEPKIAESGPDPEQVRGVCEAVADMLSSQLVTGLSRMPESVCDTVERMASLSHTAGLPNLERALRNLHAEYTACFSRSAVFRERNLLNRLSHAWRLASALVNADDETMRTLAGTFREDYERTQNLKLYLLGFRDVGGGGYAGRAYYFIERETGEFYCYRDIRPTFYEKTRRYTDAAPWELPCSLKQAWNCAMDLSNPKINASNGLSATKECKAAFLGPKKPFDVIPGDRILTDFEPFISISGKRKETDRLVLLRPASWEQQEFDHVAQRYSLRLFDSAGRDIFVEVRYKKGEAEVIRTLEHLQQQMAGGESPVFFGEIYREGGTLKLYPIEFFTDWRDTP